MKKVNSGWVLCGRGRRRWRSLRLLRLSQLDGVLGEMYGMLTSSSGAIGDWSRSAVVLFEAIVGKCFAAAVLTEPDCLRSAVDESYHVVLDVANVIASRCTEHNVAQIKVVEVEEKGINSVVRLVGYNDGA